MVIIKKKFECLRIGKTFKSNHKTYLGMKMFKKLFSNVIDKGLCCTCGACISVCAKDLIKFDERGMLLEGDCTECGLCTEVCGRFAFDKEKLSNTLFMEKSLTEELGIVRKIYFGQSTDEKILEKAQDGGVVSSLIAAGIENGFFDSCITATRTKDWIGEPIIVENKNDIFKSAGTLYTPVPVLSVLKQIKKNKITTAIVGTPCIIQTARKIQFGKLKAYAKYLKSMIGLFCSETFYSTIYNELQKFNISRECIQKTDIKGKLIFYSPEKNVTIPLKEARAYMRTCCKYCTDFPAYFADIAVGSVDSPKQHSTILVRTKQGEDLLSMAVKSGYLKIELVESDKLKLSKKLSKIKLKRCR
jgi:coenzyme F420 hydrogenase subunit beta